MLESFDLRCVKPLHRLQQLLDALHPSQRQHVLPGDRERGSRVVVDEFEQRPLLRLFFYCGDVAGDRSAATDDLL